MNRPHFPAGPSLGRAANDRAPREKRSSARRFADAMGRSMIALAAFAVASAVVAYLLGGREAAMLFTGAAFTASLTLALVSHFERQLTNG